MSGGQIGFAKIVLQTDTASLDESMARSEGRVRSATAAIKSALEGVDAAAKTTGRSGLSGLEQSVTRVSGVLGNLKSSAGGAFSSIQQGAGNLKNALGGIGSVVGNIGKGFAVFGLAANGIQSAVSAVGGLASALLSTNASIEQTTVAFTQLLGSAEASNKMVADLRKFAAETPFEFKDLANSTRLMLAFGVAADQVVPRLKVLGDTVSAFGGGAAQLDQVTRALGQMAAAGRVNAQDMNQLVTVGINGFGILAEQMHMSVAEVRELSAQGKLASSEAIPLLLQGLEKFSGGMEKQSHTLNGLISSIKDNLSQAFSTVTFPVFEEAKKAAESFLRFTSTAKFELIRDEATDQVRNFARAVSDFVVNDGPGILQVAKDLASNIGDIAKGIGDVVDITTKAASVIPGGPKLAGPGQGDLPDKIQYGAFTFKVNYDNDSKKNAHEIGEFFDMIRSNAPVIKQLNDAKPAIQTTLDFLSGANTTDPRAIQAYADAWNTVTSRIYQVNQDIPPLSANIADLTGEQIAAAAAQERNAKAAEAHAAALRQTAKETTIYAHVSLDELKAQQQFDVEVRQGAGLIEAYGVSTAQAVGKIAAARGDIDHVQDALNGLAGAYQQGLAAQQAFGSQASEYNSQYKSLSDAVDILNKRKAAGIPLTEQEQLLLDRAPQLLGRFKGGVEDATLQQGEYAAANGEVILAQDNLNAAIQRGEKDLTPYYNALQDAKKLAGDNAFSDPMTESLNHLSETLTTTLLPALQDIGRKLEYIAKPWLAEIDVATGAAEAELTRIKGLIDDINASNIAPVSSSGESAGPHTGRFAIGGIVKRPTLALVGEDGPEVIIPLSNLLPGADMAAVDGTNDRQNEHGSYTALNDYIVPPDKLPPPTEPPPPDSRYLMPPTPDLPDDPGKDAADDAAAADDNLSAADDAMSDAEKEAADFNSAAESAFNLVTSALDLLAKLGDADTSVGPGIQDKLDDLRRFTQSVLDTIRTAAGEVGTDGLDDAKTFADAASTGVGLMNSGLDLLTKLGESGVTFGDTAQQQIAGLKFMLEKIVGSLRDSALALGGDGLEATKRFDDAAQSGVDTMLHGLDLLSRLATESATYGPDEEAKISRLKFAVEKIVQSLRDTATYLGGDGLDALSDFDDAAKGGLDVMLSALDLLTRLGDSAATYGPEQEARIAQLKFAVEKIVQSLGDAAALMEDDYLAATKTFNDAASASLSVAKDTLDLLTALAADTAAMAVDSQTVADRAGLLAVRARDIADGFAAAAAGWTPQANPYITALATNVGDALTALSNTYDLLVKVGDDTDHAGIESGTIAQRAADLSDRAREIADAFKSVAATWDDDANASISSLSTAVSDSTSGLSATIELLKALSAKSLTGGLTSRQIVGRVEILSTYAAMIATAFDTVAANWTETVPGSISALSQAISDSTGALGDTLGLITDLTGKASTVKLTPDQIKERILHYRDLAVMIAQAFDDVDWSSTVDPELAAFRTDVGNAAGIINDITGIITGIYSAIDRPINKGGQADITENVSDLVSLMQSIIGAIKTALDQVPGADDSAGAAVTAVSNFFTAAESVTDFIQDASSYLKDGEGYADAYYDSAVYIVGKLNDANALLSGVGVADLSALSGAGGLPSTTQAAADSVPRFANGGIITQPTYGLIGESGAEAVIPLERLNGILDGDARRRSRPGRSGGQTVILEVANQRTQRVMIDAFGRVVERVYG